MVSAQIQPSLAVPSLSMAECISGRMWFHNDVHQEVSNAYMDPKGIKVQKSDQTRN